MGEHHVRIVGVVGSNPIPSTKIPAGKTEAFTADTSVSREIGFER